MHLLELCCLVLESELAAVTNNDGTIESQVSANAEAGFSIITYSELEQMQPLATD